jgi:large subunit ribosomal protein L23
MKYAEDVIIRPIITEKSNAAIAEGKYTFRVAKSATKPEIKDAVEKIFNVKVLSVNTMNYDGKLKSRDSGRHTGRTPAWKKAIVQIDRDPKPDTYLDKNAKEVSINRKYKSAIDEFGAAQ